MKKLNFSQTELIADIRRQFTNNSNALNTGIPARNLPVLTFKQPVEDIQTAMEIFQHCLEYEQLSIQKIERVQGEDDIPAKLYLTIIDSQTILAATTVCMSWISAFTKSAKKADTALPKSKKSLMVKPSPSISNPKSDSLTGGLRAAFFMIPA